MRLACGQDGFDGDASTLPSVPFLKPTGQERPLTQLAMHLAFRGARADGAPAHQFGDVLRRDQVEELAAGGHAHLGEIEQQLARHAQPLVDAKLPSRCGSLMRPFQPTVVRGFSK